MKNLFRKSILFIWVLFAVLFSCEEKVEVVNQEVSVAEAQTWFEGYTKDTPASATTASSGGRTDSILNSNDFQKEIFWGKARKINSKALPQGLIMPVWYENNFRFGKQAIRELWVVKENGKLNTFLVEILATSEYFKANGKIDMNNFTGTFTIHDWKKGFVAGRYYENGKVKGLLTNYKVVPSTKKVNNLSGGRADGCGDYHFVLVQSTEPYAPYGMEATTVWDPCYGDYSWIHDLDRRYDMYYDNGGNPLDDCTHRGNCAGGGGGNEDGNYYEPEVVAVVLETDDEQTCPRNFKFVSVTTNNLWQEAALTNIYCNLIYRIGNTGATAYRKVEIPILYFGLPYYNIDGKLVYDEEAAAVISTNALNFAEYDMRDMFKNNPELLSSQLEQYWTSRIQYWMNAESSYLGRVSKSGSINVSNFVPKMEYAPCD